MYKLRHEKQGIEETCKPFGFSKIRHSDTLINFFTGIANVKGFLFIVLRIKGKVELCHNRLSIEDHLLLVLVKLRLGLLNLDLAHRFGILEYMVSSIYRSWLPVVAKRLKDLIIWPDRLSVRQNLPTVFKSKFRDAICTIDCSEIFIDRPSNLTARAQTWSNYKHNNTIKYLIGITPAGAISFLSSGWGGRVSDKVITLKSGFLDKLNFGDVVLADRGFFISEECRQRGAILKIPSFTKGKKQLSGREVNESRQLARIRIHIERVIGRMRDFRILNSIIPISQVDTIDNIMTVISACVNINRSVVPQ